ncbi:GntR family transcriptional regulator [Salinisphaera sp. LB1]|uniref:GntR family transcriptional regulator n=1 Tax=Salinisphaera sp. LB1 TaxID=2183911 RepID=UPI000D7DC544|nr:GntR family transcriptional regulator [Salinisphaera sp. LB1]AWN15064.1 Transcriptional regulator, GntR family [Salinisphaera sp. LB1]
MTSAHATAGMDAAMAAQGGPDTVDQKIRRDIANAIFDQRMPPGTKLSEARLGELYEVSRTVVRKALFRLASDKLVDMRPNRGAVVSQPTVGEAREVFEARRLIESAMLEQSVAAMTSANHQRLRELVATDVAAHDSRDRQRMIRASGDFHRGLAAMSGNTVLCGFLDQLIGRTSLIIAMYQRHTSAACSHHAHSELIKVIERGDISGAQHTMRRHLHDCENELDLAESPAENELAQMLGARGARN